MTTIKSFTDISQGRKLAEILPLESADMSGFRNQDGTFNYYGFPYSDAVKDSTSFPVWSLAALLISLPNNKHITTTLSRGVWKIEPVEYIDKWFCEYEDEVDEDSPCKNFSVSADNPIDACVAMVDKLHELKML